ncbi:DMT family transporter [Tautonia plasticadhaerens]|uniref:S-adenosylmethionine/S-adenosylhomocysteine transporter n=1 Tax=Tautonia plasticadhaerens TaxID=2527974 RepID=A0A518H5F1_9BACT|nr:DMT family transporter [Tautonia plasticadhaerens]QDV36059.1 S-adenosylmethionine/S-adenosylhomocysteine transporter [Tautonia plasticadhaerens]
MPFELTHPLPVESAHQLSERLTGLRRYLMLALGAICFGSVVPAGKLVADAFPVLVASCLREVPAALILAPLVIRERRALLGLDRAGWVKILTVAALGLYGFGVLLFFGLKLTSGVVGSVVRSSSPAATAIASCAVLGEALGWRRLGAIGLAILGILAIQLGGGTEGGGGRMPVLGTGLLVLAVGCGALNTVAAKSVSMQVKPGAALGLAAIVAVGLATPAAIVAGLSSSESISPGPAGWAALAWVGLALPIGALCWFNGLSRVAASTAAGFQGLIPASALVLSYVILGEPFRWAHPVGLTIVLGGVLLIGWDDARCRMAEQDD